MPKWSIAFLALFLFASIGCEKQDDVTLIRAVVDDAVAAAERHDINAVMEHVTDDFRVNPGNRNEQSVRQVLVIALRTFDKFKIRYPVPGITVAPDGMSAEVSVPFLVLHESIDLPGLGEIREDPTKWLEAVSDRLDQLYRLKMDFTKSSGDWKVREATLQSSRTLGGRGTGRY